MPRLTSARFHFLTHPLCWIGRPIHLRYFLERIIERYYQLWHSGRASDESINPADCVGPQTRRPICSSYCCRLTVVPAAPHDPSASDLSMAPLLGDERNIAASQANFQIIDYKMKLACLCLRLTSLCLLLVLDVPPSCPAPSSPAITRQDICVI